jgi:tRNA(Arg) A34 adenosine deaminase TadA
MLRTPFDQAGEAALDPAPFFEYAFPDWLPSFLSDRPRRIAGDEERMRFVVSLGERNVDDGGGPFAAAIFGEDDGLVSVGLNRVLPSSCSMLHAEVTAIMGAERSLGVHDLSSSGRFTLVSSAQPCMMCMGALLWAGIAELVVGARGAEDVEAIAGFDEGPLPAEWRRELAKRGIAVRTDVLRADARNLLLRYRESGQAVYNARSNALRGNGFRP